MIDLLGFHVYGWEDVLEASSCGISCFSELTDISALICVVHALRLHHISFGLLLFKLLGSKDSYLSFQMLQKARRC